MAFFRQYIAPVLVVLTFLVALLAVSARSFLPADMAQPAPVEASAPQHSAIAPEAAIAQDSMATAPLAQFPAHQPWLKGQFLSALSSPEWLR